MFRAHAITNGFLISQNNNETDNLTNEVNDHKWIQGNVTS